MYENINSCMVLTYYVCITARSSILRRIPYYMYLKFSRNGGLLDVSLMLNLLCLLCLFICLECDSGIVATCPSIPAARFAFRLCFIRFVLAVRSCFVW